MQYKYRLPKYAWLPLAACFALNLLVYFGSRLIMSGVPHYDIESVIDRAIPLFKPALIVYVLSYFYWIVAYPRISMESRALCYEILTGEQLAKLICLAFFLLLPTTMTRPEIVGEGLFDRAMRLLYLSDAADNLFPSIHCMESWICMRGLMRAKGVKRWVKGLAIAFTLMVFPSTLLVKQHVIVDVFGGVAVAEIGLWLARTTRLGGIYAALDRRRGSV